MGTFYVNFAVRSRKRRALEDALRGRRAAVSEAREGWLIVLDAEADAQDPEVIRGLAQTLSRATHAPVVAAANHDDGALRLWLFASGELRDVYDSEKPGGGDAGVWCRTFRRARRAGEVEAILRSERYAFESERHAALAAELGLPAHALSHEQLGGRAIDEALRVSRLAPAQAEPARATAVGTRGRPLIPPRLVDGKLAELPEGPTQYRATFRRSDGHESRWWVDGDWQRIERLEHGDIRSITIERPDRDAIYSDDRDLGRSVRRLTPIVAARKMFLEEFGIKSWRAVRAEQVDGRSATVFEGERNGVTAERCWRDHATGLQLRMETVSQSGRPVLRTDTVEIELGAPPDGVFEPEWLETK